MKTLDWSLVAGESAEISVKVDETSYMVAKVSMADLPLDKWFKMEMGEN